MSRFFWDDFLTVFAWILSLIITILVTKYRNVTYEVMLIGAGKAKYPPNVKEITMQFARLFTVVPMIFYTGLWCVKGSFLIFFRRLGIRHLTNLNRWWWTVTIFTGICYLLCYATLPYRCTLISFKVTASKECASQGLSFISMGVNSSLDVLTDCLSKYHRL